MKKLTWIIMCCLALALTGCGGSGSGSSAPSGGATPATFAVGGTVTGLTGSGLVLQLNAANKLPVSAVGNFTFIGNVAANGSYSVTVSTQPTGQTCTVSNGSGAGAVANISNVAVTCSVDTYTIAGDVSGLTSGQVILLNNGTDPQTVTANSGFSFDVPVVFNSSYAVTVGTQPAGQICTVSNGTGAGVVANISNAAVTCSTNTYTITGSVSGLASGQVTLLNNGADPQTVTANGGFSFDVPVVFNSSFAVSVGTQPVGQTCTISNGSGAGVMANIHNVAVTCSIDTYTISGAVTGLNGGEQLTLNNNGANSTTVTSNTSFSFTTPVAYGASYAATVATQPLLENCTVTNGAGTAVMANVSNVSISCAAATEIMLYSFAGTNDGYNPQGNLTLGNNGNFYGVTFAGGVGTNNADTGTVFKVTPAGVKTQIYAFTSNLLNGSNPVGSLALGNDGNFYGMTKAGGLSGNGTIFMVTTAGIKTILHSFTGGATDGANPRNNSLTLGSDGNFYGTTFGGGAGGNGTIFMVTPAGVETILHVFTGGTSDGALPVGNLTMGNDGNFYGMTNTGGANGSGTIFKVTPAGVETILHSFNNGTTTDGAAPNYNNSLTLGTDGNFYGMTESGGAHGLGTVFKVTLTGVETILQSLPSATIVGSSPEGSLTLGNDGNFYGMTAIGGGAGDGTIFMVTPAGVGTTLYAFAGVATDGAVPVGSLTLGNDGNFYGMTSAGGVTGSGAIFRY